ncbi:hypothetical protein D3C87_1313410 [compost metagenome]
MSSKLADLPSNTIGQQLWCVIGARNSYLKAAEAQSWQGFSCPLEWDKTTEAKSVRQALESTGDQVSKFFEQAGDLSEGAVKFLLDLLEHEAQHHGQLARYLYGLKVGVPESWKKRYNFD